MLFVGSSAAAEFPDPKPPTDALCGLESLRRFVASQAATNDEDSWSSAEDYNFANLPETITVACGMPDWPEACETFKLRAHKGKTWWVYTLTSVDEYLITKFLDNIDTGEWIWKLSYYDHVVHSTTLYWAPAKSEDKVPPADTWEIYVDPGDVACLECWQGKFLDFFLEAETEAMVEKEAFEKPKTSNPFCSCSVVDRVIGHAPAPTLSYPDVDDWISVKWSRKEDSISDVSTPRDDVVDRRRRLAGYG